MSKQPSKTQCRFPHAGTLLQCSEAARAEIQALKLSRDVALGVIVVLKAAGPPHVAELQLYGF